MDLSVERSLLDSPAAGLAFHLGGLSVPAHPVTAADTPWSDRYALRTRGMTNSVIRELLKLIEDPEIISFAGGLPAPEIFPTAEIGSAAQRILRECANTALQYGTTEGYLPLRKLLVRHMARYGIVVTPANVLVTSGAMPGAETQRRSPKGGSRQAAKRTP